ncbi:hypothetical protein F5Y18DRAFT_357347 [Xylariaceae sp. FL1019]|nr:hypothetical protein F5Y18DRAFT_357347 [Xylariaceae sp. FL1019]
MDNYDHHQDLPPAYCTHDSRRQPTMQQNSVRGSQSQYLTQSGGLQRPVAIPATAPSIGAPFLRAYPPDLEKAGISRERFIDFLDGLNRVAVQSPPLQVLALAGDIVGFVPLGTAQIVGAAVNVAAKVGAGVASKVTSDQYLKKANQELFGPCSLRIEMAKLDALAKIAGLPILDGAGKIRSDTQLLDPIEHEQSTATSAGQRWFRGLEPWIAHLEVDRLPEINNTDTSLLGKWHAKASERERQRGENRIAKRDSKDYNKQQKHDEKSQRRREKDLTKLDRREQQARGGKSGDKLDKRLQKIEEGRREVEEEYRERQSETIAKGPKRDEKMSRKILWLVIQNMDAA